MFGPQVPTVTAAQVSDEAFLLDVREDDEWAAGHAPDAHHLPMHQVPARLDEVPADRDVVVICRAGARSAQVVQFLLAGGRQRVHNLAGGMQDWLAAGRPVITDDGRPARVI